MDRFTRKNFFENYLEIKDAFLRLTFEFDFFLGSRLKSYSFFFLFEKYFLYSLVYDRNKKNWFRPNTEYSAE